ncbi:hypothetical protein [Chitinibacter sp. ZOR0017]|uniref:hypothetical protein n=1 Tax=Chitinibacter sp. ZOR0017 TaxID=1339254 RepID=UPI00064883D2|nr:hypothetical protein [Chitinibacter sp. ZOR0017]
MTTPIPTATSDIEVTQLEFNKALRHVASECAALNHSVGYTRWLLIEAHRLEEQLWAAEQPTYDICKPLIEQLARMEGQFNIAYLALKGSIMNE